MNNTTEKKNPQDGHRCRFAVVVVYMCSSILDSSETIFTVIALW